MDATFRTPLLDCFVRGQVPHDVRLMAARGVLAPRVHEQVALLVLLADDPDPAIKAATEETLARLPATAVAAFLAQPGTSESIRTFFAARGIVPAEIERTTSQSAPAPDDGPPMEGAEAVEAAGSGADDADAETREVAAGGADPAQDGQRQGTAQRLAAMTVAERVKVAMQGSREERAILVRDPNRLVASAVLSSPKLSESEVESIARMTNVSDEVLRVVGTTRAWTKNYNVIAALARNAKTPIAISLTLLSRLTERDIRTLSTDRNIPEPVRLSARRTLLQGAARRR